MSLAEGLIVVGVLAVFIAAINSNDMASSLDMYDEDEEEENDRRP